jgi:amidase
MLGRQYARAARRVVDLHFRTARELRDTIERREISSLDVVDAHLRRIAQHNPALNAVVTVNAEGARQRAREADAALKRGERWGPLHGVPVTIKDDFETAGLRTTDGERRYRAYVPARDATVVARLCDAGAIVLGKTNMPARGADVQTHNDVFGRTNNPWDVARTPGGSTGGGAAAVAAGLSPLEIGSDGGGSVRLPAHYCGVFGLKPTEHAVSLAGNMLRVRGAGLRHMSTPGIVARSVEDLRLALRLIAGPDGRDMQVARLPLDVVAPGTRPLHEMRIAWIDDVGGLPVTAETRGALQWVASQLTAAGCAVERSAPDLDLTAIWRTYGDVLGAEAGAGVPAPVRMLGSIAGRFVHRHAPMISATQRGLSSSAARYVGALFRRDEIAATIEQFLVGYDAWIVPVACGPAFTHRKTPYLRSGERMVVDGEAVSYWTYSLGHCSIFNLTGNPAVVLPVARSAGGLPIGVQLVGRRWHDADLLAVAEELAPVISGFTAPPGYRDAVEQGETSGPLRA